MTSLDSVSASSFIVPICFFNASLMAAESTVDAVFPAKTVSRYHPLTRKHREFPREVVCFRFCYALYGKKKLRNRLSNPVVVQVCQFDKAFMVRNQSFIMASPNCQMP